MKFLNSSENSLAIVIVGNFNPAIINPSWLCNKKLIREDEEETATIKVIHPEVSDFSLQIASFHVTKDKMIISSENPSDFILIRDLAISIFSILSETPVEAIGLNYTKDFSLVDAGTYYEFGNWLVPHSNWSEVISEPKTVNLKMLEPYKKDGFVQSTFEISTSKKVQEYGVRFHLNYHIEIDRIKPSKEKDVVFQIENNWSLAEDKMNSICEKLINDFINE